MKTVFVFLPDTLNTNRIGILEGFLKHSGENLVFYITNDQLLDKSLKIIGYCSEVTPQIISYPSEDSSEWIHVNSLDGTIKINNLSDESFEGHKIVKILYDFQAFNRTEIFTFQTKDYGDYFGTLAKEINLKHKSRNRCGFISVTYFTFIHTITIFLNSILKFYDRHKSIISYSTTALYFETSIKMFRWMIQEDQMTLKVRNAIVSKLLDLIAGFLLLYAFIKYEDQITQFVYVSAENIISSLKELLNFLMGSPVGLKLNHAFNQALGSFFLYHLTLWRTFLETMNPLFRVAFKLLIIPGMLGLSCQAALLADFVAFSTFHIYCIYVYAARLYGIQIKAISSLSKLFIGRKYNPLRNRTDSQRYTQDQLFIGALGFTILLFLLPTTLLYYCVFTVFRLILISFYGLLRRIRFVLQSLPLYIVCLWIFNSSSVAGSLHIKIKKLSNSKRLMLNGTLKRLSLWKSIVNCLPQTLPAIEPAPWKQFLIHVFKGTLI